MIAKKNVDCDDLNRDLVQATTTRMAPIGISKGQKISRLRYVLDQMPSKWMGGIVALSTDVNKMKGQLFNYRVSRFNDKCKSGVNLWLPGVMMGFVKSPGIEELWNNVSDAFYNALERFDAELSCGNTMKIGWAALYKDWMNDFLNTGSQPLGAAMMDLGRSVAKNNANQPDLSAWQNSKYNSQAFYQLFTPRWGSANLGTRDIDDTVAKCGPDMNASSTRIASSSGFITSVVSVDGTASILSPLPDASPTVTTPPSDMSSSTSDPPLIAYPFPMVEPTPLNTSSSSTDAYPGQKGEIECD